MIGASVVAWIPPWATAEYNPPAQRFDIVTVPTDSLTLGDVAARSLAVRILAGGLLDQLAAGRPDAYTYRENPAINLRLSTMCEAGIHDSCGGHPIPQTEGRSWHCRCLCHQARRLELVR
jgi:hypothetical protein